MNVFSQTGVLKNPEGSGLALLKETFFIFSLGFLLNIETIFRGFIKDCITSIPQKIDRNYQMKGKMSLRCKITSRRKVFILLDTKPTLLKFISMVFKILYTSQNF